jgi:hypothetical protein
LTHHDPAIPINCKKSGIIINQLTGTGASWDKMAEKSPRNRQPEEDSFKDFNWLALSACNPTTLQGTRWLILLLLIS